MIRRRAPSLKKVDAETKKWIRNPTDEFAAAKGCVFDGKRGKWVIDWMEKNLRLYEGDWAGAPFVCADWQKDCIMRLFGWVRHDKEWSKRLGKPTMVRRFNQAVIFIAKKNGKSPTLAALGLYLLCGDGEQGGSSFFYAKDGHQARAIAGRHAVEMLKQSPALMSECTINKTTLAITHEPTRSILMPASSGDTRTQKSQEGFNGNVLVDEIHVVDGSLMERVTRMGISRREPLLLEVSTAGNDPDSYGKHRRDYAADVLSGRIKDQRLFVYLAEAPQDLTPAQLAKDPLKYGRMANPAMPRIVRETEFLQDYESSAAKGPVELAAFMMYRCNVWQKSANPLLNMDKWRECGEVYTLEDLRGLGGGLGMDLARTEDMSAVVFCCPMPDGSFRQWPLFWLTEEYAERYKHVVPFFEWAEAGFLTLVHAAAIKDDDILPPILRAMEVIKPRMIVFDPTFATALAEKLGEQTKIEPVKFVQTHATYSEPTAAYVQAVLDCEAKHPCNEVLTWQASHVTGHERDNLVKPAKPDETQRHRKIDGIQAAIMAFHGMRTAPEKKRSIYESRGPILIGASQGEPQTTQA